MHKAMVEARYFAAELGSRATPPRLSSSRLIVQPRVDGLFIGRAAWDARDFIDILDRVVGALRP
jgi:hypothetical protein